jgi:L-threonylcarbamoyladenylate synthase
MHAKILSLADALCTYEQVTLLKKGGVLCHPTNTCYGLGCDIRWKRSVERICALKKRKSERPFNILVQNIDQFKMYGTWDDRISRLIEKYPDQAFTFVVKRTAALPVYINPSYDTIGIQIAKGVLSDLFGKYTYPLIATSANVSDCPPCYDLKEVNRQFQESSGLCDMYIDNGVLPKRPPSTMIKITGAEMDFLRGRLPDQVN